MNNLSLAGNTAAAGLGTSSSSGLAPVSSAPAPAPSATVQPAVQVNLVSLPPQNSAPAQPATAGSAASSSASSSQGPTPAQVQHAVQQLNQFLQSANFQLNFTQDNQGTHFVQIIDTQTHQVVRQIPDQVAVALAEDMSLQVMARAAGKTR